MPCPLRRFTCVECGATFYSRAYNAKRCDNCKDTHRKARTLENYHKRRAVLIVERRERKTRDLAYDERRGLGAPESVYSSMCSIHIKRSVGRCAGGCQRVTNLVNGFCEVCRANGANESQVMNPSRIR